MQKKYINHGALCRSGNVRSKNASLVCVTDTQTRDAFSGSLFHFLPLSI